MFRVQDADITASEPAASTAWDNERAMWHRLQLNLDFIASPKTHAHLVTRALDSVNVTGAAADSTASWTIKQAWLETDLYGVGAKMGHMPISMHDDILVNHDTNGFGAILLSKSFGDTTVLVGDVRVAESNTRGASANAGAGMGADDDDVDLYVVSVLGKAGMANYQVTGALMNAAADSTVANNLTVNASDSARDWWLAATVGANVSDIDITGTLIYENGWKNAANNSQAHDSDFLAALRLKGKTGFGGWNGYAFYAGEDFNNIVGTNAVWSKTWDQSGPGGRDLMNTLFSTCASAASYTATSGSGGCTFLPANGNVSNTENLWGVGAGLTVKTGGWTINPMLDYASVTDRSPANSATNTALFKSAWGGTLALSTKLDEGTTLGITGSYVDPSSDNTLLAAQTGAHKEDSIHAVMVDVKMAF
ncbi:MAG: hypothetical protein HQL56_15735 [Magnetococcales bacterium]|nr:hypothetical protein [Magnetococcales bacterium]